LETLLTSPANTSAVVCPPMIPESNEEIFVVSEKNWKNRVN
jgi:hypothetical protein